MSRLALVVALVLMLLEVVAKSAAFASDPCEPYLTWSQIFARIRRAEALLSSGRPKNALRAIRPVADQFSYCDRGVERLDGEQMDTRVTYIAVTAVVRIPEGARSFSRRPRDEELKFAIGWIRRAAKEGDPNGWSRYGEALVARGDEESLHEAYELLTRLHTEDKILEPEGYAALTKAARAAGDEEMAAAAQKQCRKLAPGRAKRTCPAIGDRR